MSDKKLRKKEDRVAIIRDKLVKKLNYERRLGDLGAVSNEDIPKLKNEMMRYADEAGTDLREKLQEAYWELQRDAQKGSHG